MSDILVALIMIFGVVALYALPTIIAFRRRHPQRATIMVIDIALGWTLLGWIAALAWSVSSIERKA